jgi:hypothetical protein
MSYDDYQEAKTIKSKGSSLHAIIMAGMLTSGREDMCLLRQAFPDLAGEFMERYYSSDGMRKAERGGYGEDDSY